MPVSAINGKKKQSDELAQVRKTTVAKEIRKNYTAVEHAIQPFERNVGMNQSPWRISNGIAHGLEVLMSLKNGLI